MDVGNVKAIGNLKNYTMTDKMNESGKGGKTTDKNTDEGTGQIKNGNIQASELNIAGEQDTALKKLLAQKAALKVQMDQFDKDSEVDDEIKEHGANRDAFQNEAKACQDEAGRLNDLKQELKVSSGITDDSEEQKNLELLEKQARGTEALTEEELDQVANMGPLTEYQSAALEYDSISAEWEKRADNARNSAIGENQTISAIKFGLLKIHPMVDAKKEAEELLDKVDDEIQLAITEELKKKVNENLNIDPNDQILIDPQAFINQQKVTEEDLKGLAVDETV